MLSPEILRIILLLSLLATGYVLILTWNEDSKKEQPAPEKAITRSAENLPIVDPTNLPTSGRNQTNDVPDDSFLLTDTATTPSVEQRTSTTSENTNRLIKVKTPTLEVWIDRLGGDIVRTYLPKYPRVQNIPDDPLYLLVQDDRLDHYYVAQSGLIGPDGLDGKKERPLYQSEFFDYELSVGETRKIKLQLNVDGVKVDKVFTFNADDYLIYVDHIVENRTNESFDAGLFTQIKRDRRQPPDQEQSTLGMQAFVGAAITTPEERYQKISFDDVDEGSLNVTTQGGWVAFLQHYFVTAWIANPNELTRYSARRLNDGKYAFGFTGPLFSVAPGEGKTWSTQFYAGPKDQNRMAEISPNLNLTVDYGFLFFIAEPLFWLLDWLYGLCGNWGLAIVLLTLIVKLALYPLSAAGYKSMANMRRVAPQMKRIQERYANDREKLQREMMALYKKEGANPLGGCLPMLLPMPIFLALYWVLLEAVELRHAPFILWIEDLAVMDPYFVLPILMAGSMYFMQTLNPQIGDPMQIKMMKAMPLVFGLIMLWFPAGLVLYWLVNNLLSIAQQWYVIRQTENARAVSKS